MRHYAAKSRSLKAWGLAQWTPEDLDAILHGAMWANPDGSYVRAPMGQIIRLNERLQKVNGTILQAKLCTESLLYRLFKVRSRIDWITLPGRIISPKELTE